MIDALGRLTDSERRILRLLAQGHTAKSIAAVETLSVNAVNERLREARRKTGVGSSRELARLVAARENRDNLIGVAAQGVGAASSASRASSPAEPKWILLMLILTGVAAIALTLAFAQPSARPATENDPLVPQRKRLATALANEQRDAAWADAVEPALDARFAGITELVDRTVQCGTTLCQVSGRLTATPGRSIDAAMQRLQGPALDAQVRTLGLAHVVSSFGPDPDMPRQARYIAFWKRTPAR